MQPDLLTTCGIAFGSVLVVLAALAVFIRLVTTLFPDDSPEADPALMKAIGDAVGRAFPGSSLVSVEIEKKD